MQEAVPFDFQGNAMRIVRGEDGEPWINANDVCSVLGFTNPRKAIADHVDGEDVTKRDTLTEGGTQLQNYVNESGMYALIFGSTKPEAKDFKRWVTHEVLPVIRKTGRYDLVPEATWKDGIETNLALADLLRSCMELYGAMGLRGEKRLIAVRKHLRQHFGLDMDVLMPGMKDGHTMTLTELGAAFGRSAEEVSALLQELGLQILENNQWVAVDPDKVIFRIARQGPKHRFLTVADSGTTIKH